MQSTLKDLKNKKEKEEKRFEVRTDKYRWSHGSCNHNSKDYLTKLDGYKDNATFENKLTGSTSHCSGN